MVQAAGSLDDLLDGIRAAADPSRLRLLAICSQGEWTVSELCQILGQSQPRISRHLKILAEAGLLDRFREGSWVFYRRAQTRRRRPGWRVPCADCCPTTTPACSWTSGGWRRCARRGGARPSNISTGAPSPGTASATSRSTAAMVETALRELFAAERPASLLDVGTGTGRILQVLAGQIGFGLGVDLSHDMLAVARANLDQREARNCQVRHGDMYHLPLPDASFAAATLHQVLHFADDPFAALGEACRVLEPGGRLVVVDLARARAGAAARRQPASPARLQRRGDGPLVRRARPGAGAAAAAGRTRAHRRDLDGPAPARRRRRDNA